MRVKQQPRQLVATPLLKQLWDWLEKSADTIPKKRMLGKAISYTKSMAEVDTLSLGWPGNIDNNCGERAIKPFVIGR